MNIKNYLKSAVKQDGDLAYNDIAMSWSILGEKTATNDTIAYIHDSLYLVNEPQSRMYGQLVYCEADYFNKIDWNGAVNLDGLTTISNGLTISCFTPLNYAVDPADVKDLRNDATFMAAYKPFNAFAQEEYKSEVIIDQNEYLRIVQVLGQPFIHENELEYPRDTILSLAFIPALQMYYEYFPITEEQQVIIGTRNQVSVKYPEFAYKAIPNVTNGGLMAAGLQQNLSSFGFIQQAGPFYGMNQGKFGGGVSYNKPVPGFAGNNLPQYKYADMGADYTTMNTLRDMYRREHWSKVRKEDGFYLEGYSSNGGHLNITWCKWSNDWRDVAFDDLTDLRKLTQGYVLATFESLRGNLKTDSNVPFDVSAMKAKGEKLIQEVEQKWSTCSYRLIYTPMRGGHSV